jgi:hypothetical protein
MLTLSWKKMKLKYFLILLSIAIEGCTNVNIYTNGGVSTKLYFGIPVIKVETGGSSSVIKTQSFGVVKSPSVFNIGYLNETLMLSRKKCEIVLFEPTTENLFELRKLININSSICTTNKEMEDDNE